MYIFLYLYDRFEQRAVVMRLRYTPYMPDLSSGHVVKVFALYAIFEIEILDGG